MALLVVRSPLLGTTTPMSEVPDPVFADGLLGPGVLIDPPRTGEAAALAPIDGTIAAIHHHAFVVTAPDGRAVLVHLGLDTVELHGTGFTMHAVAGQQVRAGDVVLHWRPGDVAAGGRSPLSPVVAIAAEPGTVSLRAAVGSTVAAGDELFAWR